jgi:hypothetical protein
MKEFTVHAFFDAEANVWVGENEELPLTTEADTLEHLLNRAAAVAPDIAVENGLAAPGEHLRIHLVADQEVAVAI